MLPWHDYLQLPNEELSRHDCAAMNLACANGLPGSEQIDYDRCHHFLNKATDLSQRWTTTGLSEFYHPNPAEYKNSEAYFRIFAIVVVLQKHMGVRYDPAKLGAGSDVPFEFHEQFIHGAILGPGGTCATLPILYASIGRRLGYPIRLVCTKRHLFARWDTPGERINIEATSKGFSDPQDEHYRDWPHPLKDDEIKSLGYLESFTPKREFANFVAQRGFVFGDYKRYRESAEMFAEAAELTPQYAMYPRCLLETLAQWKKHLQSCYPPLFPRRIVVDIRPSNKRWQTIPWEVQREMGMLAATEWCLTNPEYERKWWSSLRRGQVPSGGLPDHLTVDYDWISMSDHGKMRCSARQSAGVLARIQLDSTQAM